MPKVSRAGRAKANQEDRPEQERPATGSSAASTAQQVRPAYRSKPMSNRTRVISLVVGDIICFILFASLGTNAHGKGINWLQSIWVAIPFLAAWFVVSPFVGAFQADVTTRPKKMALRTLLAWLATWPVAMAFRWFMVERLSPVSLNNFLSFAIVVLIANTCLLLLWRWPFSLNTNLRVRGR